MFASHYKLDNLCAFLDFNGLQIDGTIYDVIGPAPFKEKFEAFGWNTIEIDGHDFDAIRAACAKAKELKGKPTIVIMKTIKGRGVSYMENQVGWHGVAPKEEQYKLALAELNA